MTKNDYPRATGGSWRLRLDKRRVTMTVDFAEEFDGDPMAAAKHGLSEMLRMEREARAMSTKERE